MSWSIRKLFTLSPLLLSVILTGFVCLVYIIGPSFLEIVELKALDLRFLIRGPLQPGPEVVIAAIDEKSVDEIGRWPWPRSRIAEMIEAMSSAGAKVIAFDVGFF
ncbi:MAG: CHASE2 domain-containing protein, partial [Proteobacteria bacterium]|nr:CHASE2 domain-containing protein [Pseudomonadota bacterium]